MWRKTYAKSRAIIIISRLKLLSGEHSRKLCPAENLLVISETSENYVLRQKKYFIVEVDVENCE